jgi:hypothetical protein
MSFAVPPQTTATEPEVLPDEPTAPEWDLVDDWGVASFPASDPPANW